MKKIIALLLCFLMLLGVCACATTEKTTDEKDPTGTPSVSDPSKSESESATATETPSATTPDPDKRSFVVTFADQEGKTLSTATVEEGSIAPMPEISADSEIVGYYTKKDGFGTERAETAIKGDTTFYMYTMYERNMNNQHTSTQDDLDVIHVGLYEFVATDGKKLGYKEKDPNSVAFYDAADSSVKTQFLVSFQNSGKDSTGRAGVKYVIYAGDDVGESLYYYNTSVSVRESNDRLREYLWYIVENEDGTIRVKGSTGSRFITNDNGKCVLTANPTNANLKMNLVSEDYTAFIQIISEEGDIVMRYAPKLAKRAKLSEERMTKLTNDMQLARNAFYQITNYLPYETIVIRIYQDEPYYGYVYGGWNVISFNLDNAISDLGLMPARDRLNINDWNFCLLHEMGHMFDFDRGWRFYGEFSNNFKLAQVLYTYSELGASAATAGWTAENCFNGAEIKNMWNSSLNGKSMSDLGEFNLDRLLYIFVVYAERIGWENVTKARHELQAMETQVSGEKNRFWALTDTMAKYAPDNFHIKDLLDEGELEIILAELN